MCLFYAYGLSATIVLPRLWSCSYAYFFHFSNGFATIFIFAIFSNFTFENGFDMISNFTFANGFNTIFILLSLVILLLQNDAFLVRKVIFTSAAFGENCF